MVTGKTNPVIRRLELWASLTSREGRVLETEFSYVTGDLLHHAYLKTLIPWHGGASWLVNTLLCQEGDVS